MSIQIAGVNFYFREKPALQEINLKISKTGFTALLGPNGAGKSTLFALLTRLYALQSGEVKIYGQSIVKHPIEVMQRLGVVFQQSTLDLDLTVSQNLYYHAALHGMSRTLSKVSIEAQLESMDMLDRLDETVRSLNGGHRRRVEIARSLIHKPSILLLDEPTVGLDPQARTQLIARVHQLCDQRGLTVLWATHLIDEVQKGDQVVVLHQGKVRCHATSQQVCALYNCDTLSDAFVQITRQSAA